jgi:prepilin-type N-terminal cleavage/methylation domain-containing protein
MKGFTLVEVVVAITLIGIVLLPLGRLYSTIAGQMAARQQRTQAIQVLENQEALLRRSPFEGVAAGTVTLPVAELPGGLETLTVTPVPGVAAKEVTIALRWQSAAGERHLDHRLVISPYGGER